MQEITRTKCNSITNGTEGRLKDTRDNKWYWVAKLNDELCWMTQNLDYDGGGTNAGLNFPNDTTARYYDPGDKYICNSVGIATNCTNGLGDLPTQVDLSWTATDDPVFITSGSYTGTDGSTLCTKLPGSPFGDSTGAATICRIYYAYYQSLVDHYKSGNYYNYNAATNGTGTSVTSGNATGSVCPTGWSLPTSNNTNVGSFGGLTTAYSIGNNAAGSTTLRSAPLHFVYGGSVDGSSLYSAGSSGYYWPSTADNASNAYYLRFNSSNVYPTYSSPRYLGYSVRCVAR